ncbi:hypothetical protein LIA77_00707 [Sarocladium implicatum]|nr:hypothetical protein LIA77_00707 [Sarocladium implicatum]
MTTTESAIPAPSGDRHTKGRRPFSTWVRKLASFKSSSDTDRPKRHKKTKGGSKNNNPYPESGTIDRPNNRNNEQSLASFTTGNTGTNASVGESRSVSAEGLAPPTVGARSVTGTVSTDHEGSQSTTAPSHHASSVAGTHRTVPGGLESRRGGDSTFSSPAPSVRSLTTTLTTIQSVAPTGNITSASGQSHNNSGQNSSNMNVQFSQPFPTTSPASAIPAHLAPPSNPTTYTTATANNMLTDNASILTLASSSKRRRRRSMDTDASVRALAPSSLWGGSRESLPLSVLSSNIETSGISATPGLHGSSARIGTERNSLYSTTGPGPALQSERNSVYAKQGDGASVRSGIPGHARGDSLGGSTAAVASPLASPRDGGVEKFDKVQKEETGN